MTQVNDGTDHNNANRKGEKTSIKTYKFISTIYTIGIHDHFYSLVFYLITVSVVRTLYFHDTKNKGNSVKFGVPEFVICNTLVRIKATVG